MGEGQTKRGSPKIRRITTPKTAGGKLPLGTFEEWLRLQVVKPAATKPEVQVPPDSYEAWISDRVSKELESEH